MIKIKSIKFCVICMVAFVSTGFSEIHQVSKVEEIKRYTEELQSSDLAIFDIDMVLIQPAESAF